MSRLFFGLLLVLTSGSSVGNTISVTTERYTKVTISRKTDGPDCSVCVGQGSSQDCYAQYEISESQTTEVSFNCSRPQDIFTIDINRDFDCSKTCNYDSIQSDWTFFQDFNRTFTWDMKVSAASKSFQLEFPAPGMRQIKSSEQCPDKHTYSLIIYLRSGPVGLGMFCQNGTITRIQIPWKGRLTLELPKGTTPSLFPIKYSQATGLSGLAVDATLPRGKSDTDFFSAHGLPSGFWMIWNFVVPPKHNFTVTFLTVDMPECQSKPPKVKYQQDNMPPVEKSLTDEQPANYQENFSLNLTNCDVKNPVRVLLLNFRVSVFRSGVPDLCTVDLQNSEGMSLQIEKKNPDGFCEIGLDAVVQEKIVLPAGSKVKLSFLDCPKDDLILTATKTIECQSLSMCPVAGTPLTLPSIDPCLPPPLSQVTWMLNVPEQGTVELSSPQGRLHQSVPEVQGCDGLLSVLVSANSGDNVGYFCSDSKGIVEKVQISSNVTVTVNADGVKQLRQLRAPVLNVSFSSGITENLIYTVSPYILTPALIVTPNWPGPMKQDSTMSWLVNVPEDYSAQLSFSNVSWPRCRSSHAEIHIQELGSNVEVGFREDEKFVPEHNILRSFYINASNCETMENKFAFLSKISLQKKPSKLLSIILGVVAALLALLIIVLTVICLVVRKKKQSTNRSSIYFPKGIASLPGDASFSKTRADNQSHVYTTIDDTMVYGHLLDQDSRGPGHFNGHQVDSYQAFTGPKDKIIKDCGYDNTDRGPDNNVFHTFTAPVSRPRTPMGHLDTLDYDDRRMVDNVLYTFKTPGDPNPLRHSAEVLLPGPEVDSWSESEQPEPEYEEAI